MKHSQAFLSLFLVSCFGACSGEQLQKAQAATDAKTYTCRYLELQDASDPTVAKAQKLCRTDADVRKILASLAGDACEASQ